MGQLSRLAVIGTTAVIVFVVLSAFASAAVASRGVAAPTRIASTTGHAAPTGRGPLSSAPPMSRTGAKTSRASLAQDITRRVREEGIPMQDVFLPNLLGEVQMKNGLVSPLYTVGPAPMGIGDFGVRNTTGTATGYFLQSTRWKGVLSLNSIDALYLDSGVPDWFGAQLNTVMDNTTVQGDSTGHFWTQNVVLYSTLTNQLTFLDNIWNFSNPSASEPLGTFYSYCPFPGMGGPVPPIFYFCVGPTFAVSLPFTVELFLTSSLTRDAIANKAWSTVQFSYNVLNGAGMTLYSGTYDTVRFNSNVANTSNPPTPRFTVNGFAPNALGLLDESEVDLVGPGGGSTVSIFGISGTEQLQYFDETTSAFVNDPTAWNIGTDTGETSEGISETYASPGTVTLSPGPSIPMPLWNATPGRNFGSAVVQGSVTPSNSFFFFNQGNGYNEAQAAWAPVPATGSYAWAVPPGTYFARTLASEYDPNASVLALGAGTTTYSVRMAADPFIGIYTPLWAWDNRQLANLSSAGSGTAADPYILDNNQLFPLDPVFGEFNDFFFPVFSGIFLAHTTAHVDINQAAPFDFLYPANYDPALAFFGLPTSNNLGIQAYYASGISIWQSSFSGWFAGFVFFGFPPLFNPIADIAFWAVTDSLIGQNFFSDQGSALLLALGGRNVVWGNTIVPGPQYPFFYAFGFAFGIQIIEAADLIYNNIVTTPIPVYEGDDNFYTGAPEIHHDDWNLSAPEPASQVRTVNGYALFGSAIGSAWQCGNLWGSYIPGGPLPYNGTTVFGPTGFIGNGGDYCPSPIKTYGVTFTETGLASGTWSVSLEDTTLSAAAGAPIVFQAPNGTWRFNAGASGRQATPSSGTVTVAGSAKGVAISISGALAATQDVTPTATDVGSIVSFATTPSGGTGTYSYAWSFGDGGSSTSQSPSHAYTAAGTYTVTLWVNDSSSSSVTHQTSVTVRDPPLVSLPASVTADVTETLTFAATASGGTSPESFAWDWNDGSLSRTSAGSDSHAFSMPGSYAVRVTVTDAAGATSSATESVTVNALPSATASASSAAPVTGTSVAFTSTVTGGSAPLTYAWDFGDGATSTDANPSHAFAAAGPITAKLTVTDATGAATHATVTLAVQAPSIATTSAYAYSGATFVVGAVIAALIVTLLARRRKPGAKPPEEPPAESQL